MGKREGTIREVLVNKSGLGPQPGSPTLSRQTGRRGDHKTFSPLSQKKDVYIIYNHVCYVKKYVL